MRYVRFATLGLCALIALIAAVPGVTACNNVRIQSASQFSFRTQHNFCNVRSFAIQPSFAVAAVQTFVVNPYIQTYALASVAPQIQYQVAAPQVQYQAPVVQQAQVAAPAPQVLAAPQVVQAPAVQFQVQQAYVQPVAVSSFAFAPVCDFAVVPSCFGGNVRSHGIGGFNQRQSFRERITIRSNVNIRQGGLLGR